MYKGKLAWRTIAAASVLFGVAAVLAILERAIAALFLMWKFEGYAIGSALDIGANTTVLLLAVALIAAGTCSALGRIAVIKGDRVLARLAWVATTLYAISGLAILLMLQSGVAILYCGR